MVKAAPPPMATIVIDPQIKSGQARNDADVLKQHKQDLRHLSGERSLQKKLRKGSTPHLSTRRSSSEDKEGDDPSSSGRKGKEKSSSGGQKVSRPRSKSSQDQTEPAGDDEETWPRSNSQEQPTRKSACGTGAPKTQASHKVVKAPTKTDTDGHKMSIKKTHPTSGAKLPSASPKTKQLNEAEPPRKSATNARTVRRSASVGATDGAKSSRPKDVDSAAADESYRDDSKSRTKTERPKQRENRARHESSDADVAKNVSRNDEAKKSPNLMKRTKSLGSSPPSSPLRSQRERLANQHDLKRKSSAASAGSRNKIVSSVPESAAGRLDSQLKNSTRRKQVCRKSAVEGPNAAKETKQESGDGKANHGTKSSRLSGEDDNVRRSRRRQDTIDNCDSKEKDPGLRRKQSAGARPRETPMAAKALDKPPARGDKVAKTNKSETTRKDNSDSVHDRGRSRHADKPPKATKDSKKADNKKSRNVRLARSTSPERRGKGGAGIGAERQKADIKKSRNVRKARSTSPERRRNGGAGIGAMRRNINGRIKRSRSVSPRGSKFPSNFSVYRNEFLEMMANMSVYQPTVVGGVAQARHRAEHTSGTPLPLKKEKNRNS